ncbi:efflux transporter, RND family, MFP subunit [Geobacter metallireducens RCH3]|uniref:Efflux pump, RND family, membrane fusion protein n=1 Tax=Geobacter metallireducens (strain ATCC 53774 / DSM 7210 / GS-15) TaxID=269799 RepID=Q39PW1_GEOMG|nr:efflux RND transporter periplasmic adaptor subunit [Geobacter metallireducens]ABB33713.1 efflux pump, RND family, membrane fusion protein [Geobacter metallireducens GS-15]EHP85813.1 efflux transporter, RND family, MFP subunit [Geobacter metallireducens RCH3]
MNRKNGIIIGIILAMAVGGAFVYRSTHVKGGAGEHAETKEAGHTDEKGGHEEGKHEGEKEGHEGHDEHGEEGTIKMTAEVQKQNGVAVAPAQKQRLAGAISATGKVEANADRIAHVSPRISGKIVSVRASLGDGVAAGQPLVTLDSVELGEALNRYHQSKTRLALAQSNMDRIKALVEKKIAARKDILQAETDYKMAQTELHTDEERLSLYGVSTSDLGKANHRKPLLPVRSPIGGIITEKHAIVGELADPSKSLYTVADLSSVWVMVDINEKDLVKIHRGQTAAVTVSAFPDLKLKGRITYIADLVDESTRTVKARVEVANPGRKLKPEMFATIELTLAADAPPVLAVPEDALQDLDGKKVLFIAEKDSEFAARPVQTGRAAGGLVEIVSGLKEGENYAVKGSFILKSEIKKGEMTDEHGHGK